MKLRRRPRGKLPVVVACAALLVSRPAVADPLRLRGEALAQTRSPVGLLVLNGEDRLHPAVDAETVTWLGITDAPTLAGDVLTLSVRLRDVRSGSYVRAGRMILSMGAVRPLQLDGVRAAGRVFGGTSVEAFGGVPVVSRFDYRTFDWAAGGRVGQSIRDVAAFGASYVQRRSDGRAQDEETGIDATFTPSPKFTAAGRAAFDLVSRGVTDALLSVSVQNEATRGELFTTHRSPGRLLPSTSLFSVLGDFAATSFGGTVRHRAFPRLDVVATGSAQVQGGDVGGQAAARATLALDDDWLGNLGFEARRVDFASSAWTGVRGFAMLPLRRGVHVATEIELVVPDEPRGRGVVWPWALGAIGWRPKNGWETAAAVEASSGPENKAEIHVLARLSYAFEMDRRAP